MAYKSEIQIFIITKLNKVPINSFIKHEIAGELIVVKIFKKMLKSSTLFNE